MQANVVIQTAFLGDLILSIPLFKRLKETQPKLSLIVVCKKGLGDFLIQEKIADQCIEITKGDKKSYQTALNILEKFEIENIYCVHRSIRSLLFAAQIRAKKKIGFSSFFGFWVFDDQVDFADEWPEVLRIIKILETTDTVIYKSLSNVNWENLNDPNADGVLPSVPDIFAFKKKYISKVPTKKIALFPGSVWATKKWTEAGFVAVANFFLKEGYTVDLMGGPDEKQLCEQIASAAPQATLWAGRLSIAESVQAIANYDLVICNDSAAAHMASYQCTPVLTIFGPTTLNLGFRPWSNSAIIVENNGLDCRPCGKHGHQKCPLGHHNCMNLIGPQQVIDAALFLISKSYSA